MIIAAATQHDPAIKLYNVESIKYFHLARACLASRCVMENPSIPALQALVSCAVLDPRKDEGANLGAAYHGSVHLER
jgi:hypothetical protein